MTDPLPEFTGHHEPSRTSSTDVPTLTDGQASEASSSAPPGQPANPNPRSCVICRRRKVKCDKRSPCSNCAKAHLTCSFPSPGRAPRRSKKVPEGDLIARLNKLEGVVKVLRSGRAADGDGDLGELDMLGMAREGSNGTNGGDQHSRSGHEGGSDRTREGSVSTGLNKELGRLVIDHGKSRYVSNGFWASVSDEVDDLRETLIDTSEDEADYPSPETGQIASPNGHEGFIFGFNSTMVNLHGLHPSPDRISALWRAYLCGVDPVVKLFHKATTERVVMEAKDNLGGIDKVTEALMFSIYFAAVTSLSPADCLATMGANKETLITKYRFAVEQALARAGFLTSHHLVVLQAFVIFLICVRRHDDTRFVWTLTGLAIRIAQSLGLHRDGTTFNLSPYEVELRRRLWWHVCVIDMRASEDHGSNPSIAETSFDTQMPLNINDEDLSPDMEKAPVPRVGGTEMTFCLVRFEVSRTTRKFLELPGEPTQPDEAAAVVRLKEKWIEECRVTLEENYLKHCDTADPLSWVSATVVRLIMAKMWLMLHHPFQHHDDGSELPVEIRNRLFESSIEVIEYARLLEIAHATQQWGWLFRTYVQWHPIAFILSELCMRTEGDNVDRAWNAVNGVFNDWGEQVTRAHKGMLWRPMNKLMAKAQRAREAAQAKKAEKDFGSVLFQPLNTMQGPGMVSLGSPVEYQPPPAFGQSPSDPSLPSTAMADPSAPMMTDAGVLPDLNDSPENWAYWDSMVREFQLDNDPKGQVLGGVGSWW